MGTNGRKFIVYRSVNYPSQFELHLQVGALMKRWTVANGVPLDHLAQRIAAEQPLVSAAGLSMRRGDVLRLGADTVSVWDAGDWFIAGDFSGHYAKHFRFTLRGDILRGEWGLVRVFGGKRTKRTAWLLTRTAP